MSETDQPTNRKAPRPRTGLVVPTSRREGLQEVLRERLAENMYVSDSAYQRSWHEADASTQLAYRAEANAALHRQRDSRV